MNENVKILFETVGAGEAAGKIGEVGAKSEESSGKLGALGGVAAAAGVAMVGAAVESIKHYEAQTTKVGQLSDATGLSTEAASRWVEVANHAGIESGTLETGIGKLEKALGKNSQAFDQYGVTVVRAKDGTMDVNATFLNAVDALNKIQDPAQRAAAGAAMFGKGWQGMSELIGQGSDKLKKDLAAVDPANIFTQKDVEAGRGLRDAFKKIQDAGEALEMTLARALAPAVINIATELSKLIKTAEPLVQLVGEGLQGALEGVAPVFDAVTHAADALSKGLQDIGLKGTHVTDVIKSLTAAQYSSPETTGKVSDAFDKWTVAAMASGDALQYLMDKGLSEKGALTMLQRYQDELSKVAAKDNVAGDTHEHLALTTQDVADASKRATTNVDGLGSVVYTAQQRAENLKDTWDRLKGTLSDQQAALNVENNFASMETAAEDAFKAARTGAADAEQKNRDAQSAMIGLKQSVIDYGQNVLGLPPQAVTKVLADIDNGSVKTAQAVMDDLSKQRDVYFDLHFQGAPSGGTIKFYAGGTQSAAPGLAVVGENGPELVDFGSGGARVFNTPQTRAMTSSGSPLGGGTTINVYVQGSVLSDQDLVNAVHSGLLRKQQRLGSLGLNK